MRTFEAYDGFWDDGAVWVCWDGKRVSKLDPHYEVMNKSPTGFAWGYEGSGPAQLAFALLAAVIGVGRAQELFQTFKREVIAPLPQKEGWKLTEDEIRRWVERQKPPMAIEEESPIAPCVDGTENHKWVVSDENENICYCERCGCLEY